VSKQIAEFLKNPHGLPSSIDQGSPHAMSHAQAIAPGADAPDAVAHDS